MRSPIFRIAASDGHRGRVRHVVLAMLAASVVVTATPSRSDPARDGEKHMAILRVTTANWVENQYAATSWESAVLLKETEHVQWFEATIWTERSAVHLYRFDASFDPLRPLRVSPAEWIAHRESFRLLQVEIPRNVDEVTRSAAMRSAFEHVFEIVIREGRALHHGMRYSGHGSGTGGLFQNQINRSDARALFARVTSLLGKRLDFIDFGGNCTEGTCAVLSNLAPYADYVTASDLPVGGYRMDNWTEATHRETDPDYQMSLLFTPERSVGDALNEILRLHRRRWEYSRSDMTGRRVPQSSSLYRMEKYAALARTVRPLATATFSQHDNDLLTFIRSLGRPDIEALFHEVRVGYIDNRDFFSWSARRNGLAVWHSGDLDVEGTTPASNVPALQGAVEGSAVVLSWTSAPGSSPVSYVLEAGASPGASDLFQGNVGSATSVRQSVASGTYYFRVRAVDAGGTSGPSNEVSLLVGACTAPPAPGGVRSSSTQGTVTVAWNPVPGATSYVLQAGSAIGLSDIFDGSVGGQTEIHSSAPQGTYFVRVRASNACGTGSPSVESTVVVR